MARKEEAILKAWGYNSAEKVESGMQQLGAAKRIVDGEADTEKQHRPAAAGTPVRMPRNDSGNCRGDGNIGGSKDGNKDDGGCHIILWYMETGSEDKPGEYPVVRRGSPDVEKKKSRNFVVAGITPEVQQDHSIDSKGEGRNASDDKTAKDKCSADAPDNILCLGE
ncbi:hypothetical protein C8F04DRAFT_1199161 [Mycena alexandri]|uniref:Uncharacterized protein n=1 Tax=Mycena alexandri TaxID=1745969 RepID=A0AAD6S3J2_9AGAR|nr:hypothetical protein C8F04DRAFT_1199161 [Mycena alexandri]